MAKRRLPVVRRGADLPWSSCSLCEETFKNPVQTICGHTFCHKCLEHHVGENANELALWTCPECKKRPLIATGAPLLEAACNALVSKKEVETGKRRKKGPPPHPIHLSGTMPLETIEQVEAAMLRLAQEQGLIKGQLRMIQEEAASMIRTKASDYFKTNGRLYSVLYVDPPWAFRSVPFRGGAEDHYGTMSDGEIAAMPVQGLARQDCALLMWATMSKLDIAIQVMESWGFQFYNSFLTWAKTYKQGATFIGTGTFTRGNSEILLLGVRGNMVRWKCDDETPTHPNFLMTQISKHSEKPHEVRKRILDVWGDKVPRIELFARRQYSGWDVWGNEVNGAKGEQPTLGVFLNPSTEYRVVQDAYADSREHSFTVPTVAKTPDKTTDMESWARMGIKE